MYSGAGDDAWYGSEAGVARARGDDSDDETGAQSPHGRAAGAAGAGTEGCANAVELTYDRSLQPPFLASAAYSGPSSAWAVGDAAQHRTGRRDIVVPLRDPNNSLAALAREGSSTLRRFRKDEAQRRANRDAMNTAGTTLEAIQRQRDLRTGRAALSADELDRMRRAERQERLRHATVAERAAIVAEERAEEVTAARTAAAATAADSLEAADTSALMDRRRTLAESRRRLPIYRCRAELLRCISTHQVCVVEGETGSGKTTQLVQYLYEHGFAAADQGLIGCTQPRKVAAVGVARRVAEEVGCPVGGAIGYAVRLEDRTSEATRVKFMTEGVLLREVIADPTVRRYSVIVLDEAHERSVNTDTLLGVLKGVLRRRSDLRVIVTSATMNTERFANFFGGAQIFKIPGKVFPVAVEYEPPSRAVAPDYIEDVVTKVCEVHLANPLRIEPPAPEEEEEEAAAVAVGATTPGEKRPRDDANVTPSDHSSDMREGNGADILVFLSGKEEILACMAMVMERLLQHAPRCAATLMMIPLYAELPPREQLRALEPTPDGRRKCVLSTNIAETSLTIDGVRFVVDAGFMKTNVYRPQIGMNTLLLYPISQAEANQRKGRAGRTARGTCYRLYSEEQFEQEMLPAPVPEIQRSSVDSIVLTLKSIGVADLAEFDFLDPPPEASLRDSLYKLWLLGAVNDRGDISADGRRMLEFPVEPGLAKMLLLAATRYDCGEEMLGIAAMMSVDARSLFVTPPKREEESRQERRKFNVVDSDHLTLLNVFWQFLRAGKSRTWCEDNFLDFRVLTRAVDIRAQFAERFRAAKLPLRAPGHTIDEVSARVRRCLAHGYISQVARRVRWSEYEVLATGLLCGISPASAVADSARMPEYVVYHEFLQTTKEYMVCVTAVEPEWVVAAAHGVVRPVGMSAEEGRAQAAAAAADDAARLPLGGSQSAHAKIGNNAAATSLVASLRMAAAASSAGGVPTDEPLPTAPTAPIHRHFQRTTVASSVPLTTTISSVSSTPSATTAASTSVSSAATATAAKDAALQAQRARLRSAKKNIL